MISYLRKITSKNLSSKTCLKTLESDIILAPSTFNINIEKFIDIQQSSGIVVGDQNVVHMEENAKRLIEDPKGKN